MRMNFDHPFLHVCTIIIGIITAQILTSMNFSLEMKLFFVIYGTLWTILVSSIYSILEELELKSWRKKWEIL